MYVNKNSVKKCQENSNIYDTYVFKNSAKKTRLFSYTV